MFKGLGFDLDGTLINSTEISAKWIAAAIESVLPAALTEAQIKREFGKPEKEICRALCTSAGAPEATEAAYLKYQAIVLEERSQIHLFPGVQKFLEEFRTEGLQLALYTTRSRWATQELLEENSLTSFFEVILTGDDVKNLKPSPEGIALLLQALRLRPQDIAFTGDSETDLQAAEAAGVLPIQVLWSADAVASPQARHAFRDPEALCSFLRA